MTNAYLMLPTHTQRLRFTTAQWLLKEGVAKIHQYYPLTLKLKDNRPGPLDAAQVENSPKPKPQLPKARIVHETDLL